MPNDLSIVGLEDQPQQTAMVKQLIAAMAPSHLPQNGIFFLPPKEFNQNAAKLASGIINGRAATNSGGDENFGGSGQRTYVDGAYSVPAWGQMFVNQALLNHPDKLQKIMAHELGHFAAANSSEASADQVRDLYMKRAQVAQRIWQQVQNLPVQSNPQPQSIAQTMAQNIVQVLNQ